jgi:hypothetical protein
MMLRSGKNFLSIIESNMGSIGVKMRSEKIVLVALIVAAICSIASATLDAKVYTISENNISINLTPNFRLVPDQSGTESPAGLFMQSFTITGTGTKGLATLAIMDVYDENMKALGPEAISQLFSGSFSSIISSISSLDDTERDNIVGNWSTLDNNGENVTIEIMDTKGSLLSMYGKKVDMAFWNIKDDSYAFLISSFDKDITSKIVNTLEIN